MLYEVMKSINNFFEVDGGRHSGEWEVTNGVMVLPFLKKNQYFMIEGSVFNDGVYKYSDDLVFLEDELFKGTITELAIPPSFIALCKEIEEWDKENGKPGQYQSESFGGYSYTRGTNSKGYAYSWMDAFGSKLRMWRKI